MDSDSLVQRLLDLPLMRRHVVATFQAGHMNFTGSQADHRAGHVNGHVAPAQHQHSLLALDLCPRISDREVRNWGIRTPGIRILGIGVCFFYPPS